MAIEINGMEKFKTLYGISYNKDEKTIDVQIGCVSWDCDVQCICDAIEYLATTGAGNKSITIKSFNLRGITINAGESPVDVYERIRQQYGKGWYWDPMPKEIAEAQEKFEARQKKDKKGSGSEQLEGSEPGEKE